MFNIGSFGVLVRGVFVTFRYVFNVFCWCVCWCNSLHLLVTFWLILALLGEPWGAKEEHQFDKITALGGTLKKLPLWPYFGLFLETFWIHFGQLLETIEVHFGNCLEHFGAHVVRILALLLLVAAGCCLSCCLSCCCLLLLYGASYLLIITCL